MSRAALQAALPEAHRKHLDPGAPAPARMMAARGLLPLPPREMVIVLAGLAEDPEAQVADTARKTLTGLPDAILHPALDSKPPPEALGALARGFVDDPGARAATVERIVLQRETPDDALALLAPVVPGPIAEILAENQERCLRSAALVDGLRKNPSLLRSSLDRMFDFLVRSGVVYDDMPEYAAAMARLSPAELRVAADRIPLPPQLDPVILEEEDPDSDARVAAMVETLEELTKADASEEVRHERVPLLKLLATLNTAQKISLAIKGNKEARTLLLRDNNRVVATAAIRNPRITEQEVLLAASSRSVDDEVVRIISKSKELSRPYAVKRALVYNPKTPAPTAMHLLTLLRVNDLRDVAKSKNVPTAVASQARRMLNRRK